MVDGVRFLKETISQSIGASVIEAGAVAWSEQWIQEIACYCQSGKMFMAWRVGHIRTTDSRHPLKLGAAVLKRCDHVKASSEFQ